MVPERVCLFTVLLVLLFSIGGCAAKQTGRVPADSSETSSDVGCNINPSEVEWITRTGGPPGMKWKMLLAQKDADLINKIVNLINTADKAGYNAGDYGGGSVIKYRVSIAIKLRNGDTVSIEPLFKVTDREVGNGWERRATAYEDRALLKIEGDSKEIRYTLQSEEMAKYLLCDADKDIPTLLQD